MERPRRVVQFTFSIPVTATTGVVSIGIDSNNQHIVTAQTFGNTSAFGYVIDLNQPDC